MPTDPVQPFRWDLARPEQLGGLVEGLAEPAWLDDLTVCAGKVLARSEDGDVFFVGRSCDSVHDLLRGALAGTSRPDRVRLLPLSLAWDDTPFTSGETERLRTNLAAVLPTPREWERRRRPVVFADIVAAGRTFARLYAVLRAWAADERANWPVIRRKLRFIGLTEEGRTSPNTWRWHQHAPWTRELPASAIANVSIDRQLFHYLGGWQKKTTVYFHRRRWWDESLTQPRHDDDTREALRIALAYTEAGKTPATRRELARVIHAEPAIREPWARALAAELRR